MVLRVEAKLEGCYSLPKPISYREPGPVSMCQVFFEVIEAWNCPKIQDCYLIGKMIDCQSSKIIVKWILFFEDYKHFPACTLSSKES